MIKTDIVAYVSSYALEGELIVPSAVLTSTPQEEEINLTYTPNFQLKLIDKNSYAVDDVLVSFSYTDTNYTAHMNVVNRTQDGIVTLQYNNGLTSKEIPTPEPETLDVIMMTGNENQWQSPSVTDYIEVTDPYQNDPETGEPPLRVTDDCTFSCGDSNITINGIEITASAPGVYEITAQDNNTGRSGSVLWTITEAQPEPVDPLDSTLTITGPLTPDPEDSSQSIVYSQETQDVYIKSKGMTYDSDHNGYEFVLDVQNAQQQYWTPITHMIGSITFVNLDPTYKDALLQTSINELGIVTEDGDGGLVWQRTDDYDPANGLLFDFTKIIQEHGETMTFEEIRITLTSQPEA